MRKITFALIFSLLLFACAFSNEAYEQKLASWVGKNEQTLIASWGRPTAQKVLENGQTILTYIKQNEYFVPMEYFYDYPGWADADIVYDPFLGDDGFAPYAQIVDTEVEQICQTTFVVQNNIITSYHFRGNNCN